MGINSRFKELSKDNLRLVWRSNWQDIHNDRCRSTCSLEMKQNGGKAGDALCMPLGTMFTIYDQDGNEYLLREDK